jgi:Ca-activated chloride channel family protein
MVFAAVLLSCALAFPQIVEQTLSVDVELVTVGVSVTDAEGRRITGLDEHHFRIWEDKIEQKIESFAVEESPVAVGIVFDISGSMKSSLEQAREAALTFLKSVNADDEYFLVLFADRPRLAQDFTRDADKVKTHFWGVSAKGGTSLYDGVYLGLETLRHARNTRKALLVISDGEDNRSRYNFSDLKRFAAEEDVKI